MIIELFLVSIISLLVLLWIGKSFKSVVLFLAFFIPFEELIIKFMPVSDQLYSLLRYMSELVLLITLLALIIKKIIQKKSFVRTAVDMPVLIFASTAFLSGLLNQIPLLEILLFLRIVLRYYALYFLLVNIELDEGFTKKIIRGLVFIVTLQFLIGMTQIFFGSPVNKFLMPRPSTLSLGSYSKEWVLIQGLREKGHLVFGTFGDPVNLGLFILVILTIVIGIYFVLEKPDRKIQLFFIISFLALFFTYSVGLLVTLFIGLLFLALVKRKWGLVAGSSLIVFMIFLMVTFYPAEFIEVATSHYAVSPLKNFSATFSLTFLENIQKNRLFTLIEVPRVILSHSPLFGFGPGWALIKGKISSYWLGDVYWAQMLGQLGFIGLLTFFWILRRFYNSGFKVYKYSNDPLKKGIALGFLGVVVGVFFYDFIGPALETRPLAFYFWLFAGLIGNWSKSVTGNAS